MSAADVKQRKVMVVGCGPCGCSAALTAAREGHEVVLLESKRRETLMEKDNTSFQALQDLTSHGDALDHLSAYGIRVATEYQYIGAHVIGPNGKGVDIRLKRLHGHFVRRGGPKSMDALLLNEVEKEGIDVRFDTRVTETRGNGSVKFRTRSGTGFLRSDVIIAADGIGTSAGKDIAQGLTKENLAIGVGYHFRGDHGFEPGVAECCLGSDLCPGEYAYVLPTEREFSLVTTMRPHLMKEGIRPEDHLRRFLSIPSIKSRISDAVILNEIRGAVPVTTGRSMGKGKILLAGEGAGLTDPLLGFGIVNAIESGAVAGRCVKEEDPLKEYSSIISRTILPDLRSRYRVRKKILDTVDDRTLDRTVRVMDAIVRKTGPDPFFDEKQRKKALIRSLPSIIGSGGVWITGRYLLPLLHSNFLR